MISKFEIHSKLSDSNVRVTVNGIALDGKEKIQVINNFNEADFLQRYNIHRGTEKRFLDQKNNKTSLIFENKQGQKDIRLHVYCYNDHVDVVKQYKKKLVSYRLHSDVLQKIDYFSTLIRKFKTKKNQSQLSHF
jgi:hypothetical protein